MKKNLLDNFIIKIKEFPLWIKQVIFFYLYQDLKHQVADDFLFPEEKDLLHVYVPELSYIGKTELEERTKGLDPNVYTFLETADSGMSIMECALNHFWTLEETCKYFLAAVDIDLIKGPIPVNIIAMSGFMAGRYRTGEYFKRIGKINVDQLEMTLRRQKELTEQGQKARIAEIMIDLGFITKEDTESLIVIKEESKKRFILDSAVVPNGVTANDSKYLSEIDELKKQNAVLKAKLVKLLSMFKKK